MTIMEGRFHAARQAADLAISQAWHAEAFARQKRLKPLGEYLSKSGGPQGQSGAEMVATLHELRVRGAPMNIRRVEGD